MKRTNWYEDHPPACTCAECTATASDSRKVQAFREQAGKIGRNQVCPCGSGKKYKRCHGA